VFFKAFRLHNRVILEVGDDGRGIAVDKVVKKVLDAGIVKEDDVRYMDREQKLLLICAPGLSTMEKVSEVSGRGVGMDVVKSTIESLGGTLLIFSELNMGTTFRVDLPLTAAIINVFKIGIAGVEYGLPVSEVERVVEIKDSDLINENRKMYYQPDGSDSERIDHFDLEALIDNRSGHNISYKKNMLIIQNGNGKHAIGVEDFYGVEEVIVKPLSNTLKYMRGISGVSVLPTGKPMFILNVAELL